MKFVIKILAISIFISGCQMIEKDKYYSTPVDCNTRMYE